MRRANSRGAKRRPISLDTRVLRLLVFGAEKTKRNPLLNAAVRILARSQIRAGESVCIWSGFLSLSGF
jgi:hypothetical protein